MGTRHLITVTYKKKLKVAQYGQWDGYPTGQGITIARFLKSVKMDEFKKSLEKVKFISSEEALKKNRAIAGNDDGWITMQQSDLLLKTLPELHRDTGAKILWLVARGDASELRDDNDFREDGLMCEYVYDIDMDKETVKVTSGSGEKTFPFNKFTEKAMAKLEEKWSDD